MKKNNYENGDFVPIFLSEIPTLFKKGHMPLDVAIVTVSPPDQHGYCTLGTSVDIGRAAVIAAAIARLITFGTMLLFHFFIFSIE